MFGNIVKQYSISYTSVYTFLYVYMYVHTAKYAHLSTSIGLHYLEPVIGPRS